MRRHASEWRILPTEEAGDIRLRVVAKPDMRRNLSTTDLASAASRHSAQRDGGWSDDRLLQAPLPSLEPAYRGLGAKRFRRTTRARMSCLTLRE